MTPPVGDEGDAMTNDTSILRSAAAFRKGFGVVFLIVVSCNTKGPTEGKSVADFEAMVRGTDPTAQAQGALGLGKLGPAAVLAVPALTEALKSPAVLVRQNAALALGEIGPEARSAAAALIGALADPEWQVRRASAVALGKIGPDAKAAEKALEKLTADKNSLVQKAAREALRKVKGL
jgi:HEAT repeat protein